MRSQFSRTTTGIQASDVKIDNVDLRTLGVTERSFKIKDEVKKFTVTEPVVTEILPTDDSEQPYSPVRY